MVGLMQQAALHQDRDKRQLRPPGCLMTATQQKGRQQARRRTCRFMTQSARQSGCFTGCSVCSCIRLSALQRLASVPASSCIRTSMKSRYKHAPW